MSYNIRALRKQYGKALKIQFNMANIPYSNVPRYIEMLSIPEGGFKTIDQQQLSDDDIIYLIEQSNLTVYILKDLSPKFMTLHNMFYDL